MLEIFFFGQVGLGRIKYINEKVYVLLLGGWIELQEAVNVDEIFPCDFAIRIVNRDASGVQDLIRELFVLSLDYFAVLLEYIDGYLHPL